MSDKLTTATSMLDAALEGRRLPSQPGVIDTRTMHYNAAINAAIRAVEQLRSRIAAPALPTPSADEVYRITGIELPAPTGEVAGAIERCRKRSSTNRWALRQDVLLVCAAAEAALSRLSQPAVGDGHVFFCHFCGSRSDYATEACPREQRNFAVQPATQPAVDEATSELLQLPPDELDTLARSAMERAAPATVAAPAPPGEVAELVERINGVLATYDPLWVEQTPYVGFAVIAEGLLRAAALALSRPAPPADWSPLPEDTAAYDRGHAEGVKVGRILAQPAVDVGNPAAAPAPETDLGAGVLPATKEPQ